MLIYPSELNNSSRIHESNRRTIKGYGGEIGTIGLPIPKTSDYFCFCKEIRRSEEALQETIKKELFELSKYEKYNVQSQ